MKNPGIFNFSGNWQNFREAAAEKAALKNRLNLAPEGSKITRRNLQTKINQQITAERRAVLKLLAGGSIAGGAATALTVLGINALEEPATTPNPNPSKQPFGADQTAGLSAQEEAREYNYLTVQQTRELYDSAFDLVTESIPDDFAVYDTDANIKLSSLSAIKGFRKNHVRWAHLQGDHILALEPGTTRGGWIAVITHDNPHFEAQQEIMHVNTDDAVSMLKLKAIPFTAEWAGIFLFHELIHLYDRVAGIEPANPSREQYMLGEVRAFVMETALVDHLSHGAYTRAMDALIAELNLQNTDQVLDIIQKKDGMDQRIYGRLNSAIPSERPKSPHEEAMKAGFFFISLSQRILERNPQPGGDIRNFITAYEQMHAFFVER